MSERETIEKKLRWTCFICKTCAPDHSICSLDEQEAEGNTTNFVDGNYRIYLRCSRCLLAFHADCSFYELEPLLTGTEYWFIVTVVQKTMASNSDERICTELDGPNGKICCLLEPEIATRLSNDPEFYSSFVQAVAYRGSNLETRTSSSETAMCVSEEESKKTEWSEKAAELLVSLRLEDDLKCQLHKAHKTLWNDIAKRMTEKGYSYSGIQCSNKWKTVKREYKNTVDHNNKSGNDKKSCKFYEELNDLYGTKPSTTPSYTMESTQSSVPDSPTPGTSSGSTSNEKQVCSLNSDESSNSDSNEPVKKLKKSTTTPGRKIRKKCNRKTSGIDKLLDWMTSYQAKQEEMQQKSHDFMRKENHEKIKRMDRLLDIYSWTCIFVYLDTFHFDNYRVKIKILQLNC